MSRWRQASMICLGAVIGASSVHAAPAGVFDDCGAAPKVPKYTLDTVAHFNDAVDRFQKYQIAVRDYDSCVIKRARKAEEAVSAEARRQISAIHDEGMAIHGRLSTELSKISADFRQASAKLKKGR